MSGGEPLEVHDNVRWAPITTLADDVVVVISGRAV